VNLENKHHLNEEQLIQAIVDAADLTFFMTRFFSPDLDADLNSDAVVGSEDLTILRIMFFRPPGPSGPVP